MEKLEMKTARVSQENIEKIRALFPNAVTEVKKDGKVELAVDFDVLKQELSDTVIEAGQERYQMTWPDKRKAVALANSAISATLRPCKEESVDFDTTENLYIEGDNLDVLKLLRETYLGKVKMIYIDPPYNTNNDSFVYSDCYSMDEEEFLKAGGYYDENGNRVVDIKVNNESNGRFHTDWLNMIYPRLKVARDLLTDDGVIFISIDDNEQANLKKICDEVFGESNFIAQVVWQKIHSIKNDSRFFSENHEYALIYAKEKEMFELGSLPRTEEMDARYKNPDNDERGPWQSGDLVASGERSGGHFEVVSPLTGKIFDVPAGKHWVYSKENLLQMVENNEIWFGADGNAFPRKKRFLSCVEAKGRTANTLWLCSEVGHNQTATKEVKHLFGDEKVFDFPKPIGYIKQMISLSVKVDEHAIILDFFSGSATTAHAVMQLNAEDGGNRKFIMVQLPEKCDEKSEAYKAGYKNICEIGKERIRRAGRKILADKQRYSENGLLALTEDIKKEGLFEATDNLKARTNKTDLDVGFRVLKLDSSNMQDVFYNPSAMTQSLLDSTVDNVKSDRTSLDLLFQVMLELGKPLSAKIEEREVDGKKYYAVDGNDLIACFDDDLGNEVITAIAKQKPLYAVFKDKSFATDSVGINNEQLFKTYSPATVVKVI